MSWRLITTPILIVLLVCERCEKAAVKAGELAAHELVGRHVHLGHVVAQKTCCIRADAAKEKP